MLQRTSIVLDLGFKVFWRQRALWPDRNLSASLNRRIVDQNIGAEMSVETQYHEAIRNVPGRRGLAIEMLRRCLQVQRRCWQSRRLPHNASSQNELFVRAHAVHRLSGPFLHT